MSDPAPKGPSHKFYTTKQELDKGIYKDLHFTSTRRRQQIRDEINDFLENVREAVGDELYGDEELENSAPQLLQDGRYLIDLLRAEMHRKMLLSAHSILGALIGLSSGTLFLVSPRYEIAAAALSTTSSLMEIATVFFEKFVSKEAFLSFERTIFHRKVEPLMISA
jgi:hypothetical protein